MIKRIAFISLGILLGLAVHAASSPPKASPTAPAIFEYGVPTPVVAS